jgi:O-antigen/teichoic acid export membrane protein
LSSDAQNLRSPVLRGLAWKGASQIFLQGSRIVVAVILARMLSPHDYGLAAMALVLASLGIVFSDVALGAALVQRTRLSEADRSTAFWTSVAVGVLCTVLGVGLSGVLADLYGDSAVQPLFAVLSLSFLVTSLATTHEALLVREMNFRSLELRMMIGTAAGAVAGIFLAAKGYGAWAIIGQQLAIAAVSTALLWLLSPWRPTFSFSRASLRSLGGFSGNVFAHRLLYYLHRNVDNLLIGRFLGPAALGVYGFAYNVMLVPFSRIAGPLTEVLFPAFSRMQHDRKRMTAIWVRAIRLVASFSVPALLGLVVVAPDFVSVVLGAKWADTDTTILIQILAWVGLLQSLQTLNPNILQALDKTDTLLRYTIVFFALHMTAFAVGLQWGVVGVAVGYLVSSLVVEPLFAWVTTRALGISPLVLVRGLSGVFQASALMFVAVLSTRLLLLEAGIGAPLRLLATVAVGIAVYVPCWMWRAGDALDELKTFRRRPQRQPTALALEPPA